MSGRYKQRTKMFGIPVPGYNDSIWPEMEIQKYQIIENMLMAAMRGVVSGVFDEGDMILKKAKDGAYSVSLAATGQHPSVRGMTGGAYFEAPSSVVWDKLEEGKTYYLYVKGSSKTFLDSSDVRPIAHPRRMLDNAAVLIAKVVLDGDKSRLDRSPDGKIHSRDISQHVVDNDNPHGTKVIQDEMLVKNRLILDDQSILEMIHGDKRVEIPVELLTNMLLSSGGKDVVDFSTAGEKGVALTAKGKVKFVQVVQRSTGGALGVVGEVAVGYFGEDSSVVRPDQFVVKNKGDTGIPMKALVLLESTTHD